MARVSLSSSPGVDSKLVDSPDFPCSADCDDGENSMPHVSPSSSPGGVVSRLTDSSECDDGEDSMARMYLSSSPGVVSNLADFSGLPCNAEGGGGEDSTPPGGVVG